MDIKRHLKSALKQLGFDKPRKAQIIPMKTLDAGQDAIVIAATSSGKQVIYETVGLAHSDRLTIVIEPLLALIYNQVQTLKAHNISAEYIDKDNEGRYRKDLEEGSQRQAELSLCDAGTFTEQYLSFCDEADGYLYGSC